MVGPATTAVNGCLKTNLSSASFVIEYSAHLCCGNNDKECLSTTADFGSGYASLLSEGGGGYASLLPECGGGGGGYASLLPDCGGGGGGGGGGGYVSLLPEYAGCREKASLRLGGCKSPWAILKCLFNASDLE